MSKERSSTGATFEQDHFLNSELQTTESPCDSTISCEQSLSSLVTVIIPTLNEAESLPLVLAALPAVREVVVVDNGSTDRSAEVARELGATVVVEPQRGYGAACLAGIDYLRTRIEKDEVPPGIVAFVDGDFSDHPEELEIVVAPLVKEEADFVIGSRMLGKRERGALLPQAIFGNKLACFLMWLFWRASYTDLGPFRALTWEALEAMQMTDENFGWTIEMQIKAKKIRLRCVEVPVSYRKRIGESKISGTLSGSVRAGYKILYTIFKYAFTNPRSVATTK